MNGDKSKEEFSSDFKRQMHAYFQREWKAEKTDPERLKIWLQRTFKYDKNMVLEDGSAVEWLWNELRIEGRNIEQKRLNLQILVANLINQTVRPIQISRTRKNWIRQYHHATYQTIEIIDAMCELGYIDMKRGYVDKDGQRRQTRFWATDKLLDHFTAVKPYIRTKPKNLVELRQNGELVRYVETQETLRVKKILNHANEVNGRYDIRCGKWKIDPTLVAIYIGDFNHYGRLHSRGYRHYQGINKKKLRPTFTIDSEPCVELDYSSIHPAILYAAEGIQLEEDPYMMIDSDSKLRKLFKSSLLIMVNADYVEAQKAINEKILNHWEYYARLGYPNAAVVIDKILEAHEPISEYLLQGGDTGLKLMNKDSKICLNVVRRFTRKGWPILPIHDSFITQAKYKDELVRIMQDAYQRNMPEYTIKIKAEWIGT